MEYGAPIPLRTPSEDDRTTMQTGASFAAHSEPFVFVEASWRDVPSATRDQLRAFRLWLQRDLGVRFDLSYYREEREPLYARMSMVLEHLREMVSPYGVPKAQRDNVPWNGQISTARPEFVRLDIDRPAPAMLHALAHEARHVWQFTRRDQFIPALLKSGVSKAVLEHDRQALIDFCESDASEYAPRAVARWRKGTP